MTITLAQTRDSDLVCSTLTMHELLTASYIPLSEAAMQDVGPAAQTLGGLYKITGKETFATVRAIAISARVRPRTCQKQIKRLHKSGWIKNRGRQSTRAGNLRRTTTLALTSRAIEHKSPFCRLPYWAAVYIGGMKLSWKARAVLAVVTSTYNLLVNSPASQELPEDTEVLLAEHEGRFQLSLTRLQRQTGLQRKAIVDAKHELCRTRIINWKGSGQNVDWVLPNLDYQITRIDDHEQSVFWLKEA